MEASATRTGIASVAPHDGASLEKISSQILGGSSEQIVADISTIRERAGVPIEWVARSYFPDLSYSRQLEIAEQLAAEVMPFVPAG